MPGKPHRNGVLALAGALALICVGDAAAATYEPTRKDDPVPGACKPKDCSLREAMLAANASNGSDDKILLKRGTYEMELPSSAGSGEDGSWWTYGATVRGAGSGRTTLDANGLDTIMQLGNFTETSTLRGLRLTGGSGSGSDPGGILGTGGRMTLKDVTVAGNVSAGGPGGAYFQPRLKLDVVNSAFTDNATTGRGGGLNLVPGSEAAVAVTIRNSRISGNSAGYGGGIYSIAPSLSITRTTISGNSASEGGGLDLRPYVDPPVTKVSRSTISSNTATAKAGGIIADGNPPTGPDLPEEPDLRVTNSTIADNKSNGDAGGILGDNAATLDVENSSIGFNVANNDSSGSAVAGGVYQHGNANFSIDDSVIAHNVTLGTMGSDSDCSATEVFSGAGNAISSVFDDGCDASFTPPFNVYTASQIAHNVADNGGPTETMALTPTSDAIGFANSCPKRDQRGKLRPANCDSGAFENRPKHR